MKLAHTIIKDNPTQHKIETSLQVLLTTIVDCKDPNVAEDFIENNIVEMRDLFYGDIIHELAIIRNIHLGYRSAEEVFERISKLIEKLENKFK